jgi:hypothetical protein
VTLAVAGNLANALPARPLDLEPFFASSDLSISTILANVRAHGADPDRFAERLGAGLASGQGDQLDLIAIAAWRAGALGIRSDALQRVGRIADAGGLKADAAAATLGIAPGDLKEFVRAQETNRWWRPGAASVKGYVAAVGGFEGFGGSWIAPPSRAVALEEDGAFAIEAAGRWWRLDADVWCTRLVPEDSPPVAWKHLPIVPDAQMVVHSWVKGVTVSLVQPGPTYLLWIHVELA